MAKRRASGPCSLANRKDVRNAVEAANAAKGWGKTTGHLRAQILYYIAENLSARADEFANRINSAAQANARQSRGRRRIERLFTYAAWADKYDGQVHGVPIRGVALAMKEPVGNIGILCGDAPLLDVITPMAAAIAMGNRTTLIPSAAYPLAATDLIQVLETSDVPAGVVNIVTGPLQSCAKPSRITSISTPVEPCGHIADARHRDRLRRQPQTHMGAAGTPTTRDYLAASTEVKNIWIPYGE